MSAVSLALPEPDLSQDFGFFFENSPLGWALCDSQGNVRNMNPALERLLSVDSGPEYHLPLSDLIHAPDHQRPQQLIHELLEGKRIGFQIDSTTNGGPALRWSVWEIGGARGATVIAVAEDISSSASAENSVRQGDRLEAVGRLAGGVAHDFNNLLTGILLYCDLLIATLNPGDRARRYADEIRKAGLQASGLVRQLLAVARPPSFQPHLLSLNEIAEGMRNLLLRLIGENIELNLCLDSNLGLVKMDPTQAQQILLNLVLNARDAMPHGGQITVETRNCKLEVLSEMRSGNAPSLPCALFVVADTGGGMSASTRAHLFEPFFTTKANKGNGLGLATVHDIVTNNGGLIHVESELDHGTRISVLLPLAPQAHDEPFDPKSFDPPSYKEKLSSKEEE